MKEIAAHLEPTEDSSILHQMDVQSLSQAISKLDIGYRSHPENSVRLASFDVSTHKWGLP